MLRNILSKFINIINIPINWISYFIPKKDYIWVFGEWFGQNYSDNSKYMFEYLNATQPNIRSIWLTCNKSIFKTISNKGFEVYNTYSLKGYYFSSIAKYIFVSTSIFDVNRFVISNSIKIQLWHGSPIKKIINDQTRVKDSLLLYYKKLFFPFNYVCYDLLISSSEIVKNNYKSAFGSTVKKIIAFYKT